MFPPLGRTSLYVLTLAGERLALLSMLGGYLFLSLFLNMAHNFLQLVSLYLYSFSMVFSDWESFVQLGTVENYLGSFCWCHVMDRSFVMILLVWEGKEGRFFSGLSYLQTGFMTCRLSCLANHISLQNIVFLWVIGEEFGGVLLQPHFERLYTHEFRVGRTQEELRQRGV